MKNKKLVVSEKLVLALEYERYSDFGAEYLKQNNFQQAIKYYAKALSIRLELFKLTPNHLHIADVHNKIAYVYYQKASFEKDEGDSIKSDGSLRISIKSYQKALDIYNVLSNEELNNQTLELNQAQNWTHIACCYYNQKDFVNSSKSYEEALAIKLKIYKNEPSHPDIYDSYSDLGKVNFLSGDYDKAISFYEEALKIAGYNQNLGYPAIAALYEELGHSYCAKKDYDNTYHYYNQALETWRKVYNKKENPEGYDTHIDIAKSFHNMAFVLYKLQGFSGAKVAAEEAIRIYTQNCSFEGEFIKSKSLYNLSLFQLGHLSVLDDNDEIQAKEYYVEALREKYFREIQDQESVELNFRSKLFLEIIKDIVKIDYTVMQNLGAAVNSQRVLVKYDPELKFGNHYHNLAVFYACVGELKFANETFNEVIFKTLDKKRASLYVEYAQFLIMHSETVKPIEYKISWLLKESLEINDNTSLMYGVLEKDIVCDMIKKLLSQSNNHLVTITSKALAGHLLITYPTHGHEESTTLLGEECN